MLSIRGITVSVGYGPLLAITLPRNMRHFTECVVVTSPDDRETQAVARAVPGVRLLITDAFRRHGARFNKGLALEEGFDTLGRDGWILIWDADILMPNGLGLEHIRPNTLHGAKRRILEDPTQWTPEFNWKTCTCSHDQGPIGFFQLFHSDSDSVRGKHPWYDVSYPHAGGGDAYFMDLWPHNRRRILPIECLHLGPKDRNWFGTDEESKRMMDAFVIRNGWHRAAHGRDHVAAATVGELPGRVQVPGYDPTGYEMMFERRARIRQERANIRP